MAERAPEASDVARELLAVLRMLEEARGLEWRKGDAVTRFESESVRPVGDVSDPTPDVALDARRLRVRLAVWEAWRDARKLRAGLEAAFRPSGVQ